MDGLVKNMSFGWAVVGHDHVSGMGLSRQRVYEGGGVNVAVGMDEIAVVRLRTKRRKKKWYRNVASLLSVRAASFAFFGLILTRGEVVISILGVTSW